MKKYEIETDKLSPNGFEFTKQLPYWEPLEAAACVSGLFIDPAKIYLFEEILSKVENIVEESLKAVREKRLPTSIEINKNDGRYKLDYSRYHPLLYKEDKSYHTGHLKCFDPVVYVKWVVDEKIAKIPDELRIVTNEDGTTDWAKRPKYNPDEKKCQVNIALGKMIQANNEEEKKKRKRLNYYSSQSTWELEEIAPILLDKDPESENYDRDVAELTVFFIKAYERKAILPEKMIGDKLYFLPSDVINLAHKAGVSILSEIQKYSSRNIDVSENSAQSKYARAFIYRGATWDIYFDGFKYSLDNNLRVRYMLEAVKNPGKTIPYSKIINIVSGDNQNSEQLNKTYSALHSDKLEQEGLNTQTDSSSYQKREAEKLFKTLEEAFLELRDGTKKEKENLKLGIESFKEQTGYNVIMKQDTIILGRRISNLSERSKKNANTITAARRRFLDSIKTLAPELYQHFNRYLNVDNGLIYDPPEDPPQWEIKDS